MSLQPRQHALLGRDRGGPGRPVRPAALRPPHRRATALPPRCGPPPPPPPSGPAPGGLSKGFSLLEWTNAVLPQGQLVSGVQQGWRAAWAAMVRELAPQDRSGAYSRPAYAFGGRIGDQAFPPEPGRYHLYLGNACPWCHRVALAAVLRGCFRHPGWRQHPDDAAPPPGHTAAGAVKEGAAAAPGAARGGAAVVPRAGAGSGSVRPIVGLTRLVADPTRARRGGWVFGPADPDPVFGAADLWQVYDTCQPGFRGRCTAPLLVDAASRTAVCNESADIVRSLDALHVAGCSDVRLRPAGMEAAIDELNAKIYRCINNGVYRSGFATSQEAYDAVQSELWPALDDMEGRLRQSRFLLGDRLTEADVWLFPTVIRLDAMYGPLFKCGRRRIFGGGGGGGDYPALAGWARDIWQLHVPGSLVQVRDTLDLDAARVSYFRSLFPLNPGGIVPAGPTAEDMGLDVPSGRGSSSDLADVCYMRGGLGEGGGGGR